VALVALEGIPTGAVPGAAAPVSPSP
jgi:hypothetical protein